MTHPDAAACHLDWKTDVRRKVAIAEVRRTELVCRNKFSGLVDASTGQSVSSRFATFRDFFAVLRWKTSHVRRYRRIYSHFSSVHYGWPMWRMLPWLRVLPWRHTWMTIQKIPRLETRQWVALRSSVMQCNFDFLSAPPNKFHIEVEFAGLWSYSIRLSYAVAILVLYWSRSYQSLPSFVFDGMCNDWWSRRGLNALNKRPYHINRSTI